MNKQRNLQFNRAQIKNFKKGDFLMVGIVINITPIRKNLTIKKFGEILFSKLENI